MFLLRLLTFLSSLSTGIRFSTFVESSAASSNCAALKIRLSLENTTILDATHVTAGSNLTTPGSCQSSAVSTVAACRVQAVVNTTEASSVHFEVWLPDTWFGRFLAVGNGGLAGCIDYNMLDYGSTLHFATVGSDNGHDGNGGIKLLNQPEVINDFAFRAIHIQTVLGKQISNAYYQRSHSKSFYIGCSTGGRQGIQEALLFPDDFDGIVAGSPAVDFNHLLGWLAMLGRLVGAPHPNTSDAFIPADLWPIISDCILQQCDGLDGIEDGIISDPDQCVFRPEALLCTGNTGDCLTAPQVAALRRIYQPLFGTEGQLLYPRYDPGSEADENITNMFGGDIFSIASDWFKFAIFNDSSYSFDNFSLGDIEFADTINPGGIATWNGDLSAFRDRGGKLLSYHGSRDQLIAYGGSLRMYNLISSTLSLPTLDDFYRLFLVPGMGHCARGPGAWAFGQMELASNLVNDTEHNILLALVDWVESDRAPDVIVGTLPGNGSERTHCRYPQRSAFNGTTFICQSEA